MQVQRVTPTTPKRPKYEEFGIAIEERGATTHVFKEGNHLGSFTIDIAAKTLRFQFPDNEIFNYCAYIASDLVTNRVQWVNESLTSKAMTQIQAGVAFLGFAKFEELMAYELDGQRIESIH
ncbi:MAG: hypothetical protein CMM93_05470 [Rickettsiales bacterium]|nr:hypothetical protein [Rickettsiales bacterium]|tara:strand:- start:3587 stop:3949 length:363 start_codon:yes stop_codon:yes gene_type:complete